MPFSDSSLYFSRVIFFISVPSLIITSIAKNNNKIEEEKEEARRKKQLSDERLELYLKDIELSREIELSSKQLERDTLKAERDAVIKKIKELSDVDLDTEILNKKETLNKLSKAHQDIIQEQVEAWIHKEKKEFNNRFN